MIKWSYFEVMWLLKQLDYPKGVMLWYHYGGEDLNIGLKEFINDKHNLEMVDIAASQGIVHLYVENFVEEVEVLNFCQVVSMIIYKMQPLINIVVCFCLINSSSSNYCYGLNT